MNPTTPPLSSLFRIPRFSVLGTLSLGVLLASVAYSQPTFTPIGPSDTDTRSYANDVSYNGQVVVGTTYTNSTGVTQAFRWENGAITYLGWLPNDFGQHSDGYGTSADGQIIAGVSGSEAFIWNATDGIMPLSGMPVGLTSSEAYRVSADGTALVGSTSDGSVVEAFRWSSIEGYQGLGDLPGGGTYSVEGGISGDGTIAIGDSGSVSGGEAFRWTQPTGMVGLGDLPGGDFNSQANAISADGATIVGRGSSTNGFEAFLWTESGGMIGLGDLPGGRFSSEAYGVSNGATRVVGSSFGDYGNDAILWTPQKGMRSLKQVLSDVYGLRAELAGWTLGGISAMSPDGKWVVGTGMNPSGHFQGWRAHLDGTLPYDFRVLHDFKRFEEGFHPRTGLIEGVDGRLYGTTWEGGASSGGAIFAMQKDGSGYQVLRHLRSVIRPMGRLVQRTSDLRLYGTTSMGGKLGGGTIFSVAPDGSGFKVMFDFDPQTTGGYPETGLVEDSSGFLYGTTRSGGANGGGTIFRFLPNDTVGGIFSVIRHMGNNDGGAPGQLTLANDGYLYGISQHTAGPSLGALFRLATNGNGFQLFKIFSSAYPALDGFDPRGYLFQGADGRLYGTCYVGGITGNGTAFAINTNGTGYQVLWNFNINNGDGARPESGVVQGSDFRLYGSCSFGGGGGGTIFALELNGSSLQVIKNLDPSTGELPSPLFLATDMRLYGTTRQRGGPPGQGTVFSIDDSPSASDFTTLHVFTRRSDGADPSTGLVQGEDGRLFGAAKNGGDSGAGAIYSVNPDGSDYEVVHSFQGMNGIFLEGTEPTRSLFLGMDDRLYGVTQYSGQFDEGTIFAVQQDGSQFAVLHHFSDTNPIADFLWITQALDGRIYGVSSSGGGGQHAGELFAIDANGQNYARLYTFSPPGLTFPYGPLLEVGDGRLFGASLNVTAVFAYDRSTGNVATIHTLDPTTEGRGVVSLALTDDGLILGTTDLAGVHNGGSLFLLDPNDDSFSIVHSFTPATEGSNPQASLVKGIDAKYYGTTTGGGKYGNGSIYRVNGDGSGFEVVYHLNALANDPINIGSPLLCAADGSLFGTGGGGLYGVGGLFRFVIFDITPVGENVPVTVAAVDENGDPVEDAPSIQLNFDEVTSSGSTTVTITDSAPPLPAGLKLGDPPIFLDIETTATFDGMVEVSINYSNLTFAGDPADLRLAHYKDGEWKDITVLPVDVANKTIYGLTSSFSPFAIVETDDPVELLSALVDAVAALNVSHGISNSLDTKLSSAKSALTDVKANNDISALNVLMSSFINAVEAQSGKQILESEANDLIARANAIVSVLRFSIH